MNYEEFKTLKVGDKVKITSTKFGHLWNEDGDMDHWLGKVMTIRLINHCSDVVKMMEDFGEYCGDGWNWTSEMIECKWHDPAAVDTVSAQIYVNQAKRTVVCKLPDGRIGKAKCNPEDGWDEATGIKLAVDRAYGKEEDNYKIIVKSVPLGYRVHVGDLIKLSVQGDKGYGGDLVWDKVGDEWHALMLDGVIIAAKYMKPKWNFTEEEKTILRMTNPKYKWMAKDEDGVVWFYGTKPIKYETKWGSVHEDKTVCSTKYLFYTSFDTIKWEDEEPCEFRKYI